MEESREKVYCSECKHLGLDWFCFARYETWLSPYDWLPKDPEELNKNNDCKYFEKREPKKTKKELKCERRKNRRGRGVL